MDILGPKGLGFLLCGERVERNLKGHFPVREGGLVGCLVGSLSYGMRDTFRLFEFLPVCLLSYGMRGYGYI